MTGFGLSYMAYLAILVRDVEHDCAKRECVDVGAKFEGETEERRNGCSGLSACPFPRARFGIRNAVGKTLMVGLIHQQRLPNEIDTF